MRDLMKILISLLYGILAAFLMFSSGGSRFECSIIFSIFYLGSRILLELKFKK